MGIKCLSLFFIDEVSKYRQYDEDGNERLGEYGEMFEQEYLKILNDNTQLIDTPYQKYLKSTCSDVNAVHKGYFSIDKKTGRSVDSKLKRGSEFSDDISAYDLILKIKKDCFHLKSQHVLSFHILPSVRVGTILTSFRYAP